MLQNLHKNLTAKRKEQDSKQSRIEEKKREAEDAVKNWANAAVVPLNIEVAEVFSNQQRLEYESKKLLNGCETFQKQNHHWQTMIHSFQNAFKELGDLKTWTATIEEDLKSMVEDLKKLQLQLIKSETDDDATNTVT